MNYDNNLTVEEICEIGSEGLAELHSNNYFEMFMCILFIFNMVLCFICFIRAKKYYTLLQQRFPLFILNLFGAIIILYTNQIRIAFGNGLTLCSITILFAYLTVPCLTIPEILNMLNFINKIVYSSAVVDINVERVNNSEIDDDNNQSLFLLIKKLLFYTFLFKNQSTNDINTELQHQMSSNNINNKNNNNNDDESFESPKIRPLSKDFKNGLSVDFVKKLKFLTSPLVKNILVLIYLSPFLILGLYQTFTVPYRQFENMCTDCGLRPFDAIILAVGAGLAIIIGLLLGSRVRNYPDTYGIIKTSKYYFLIGLGIAFIGYLLDYVVVIDSFRFTWIMNLGVAIGLDILCFYQIYLNKKFKHGNIKITLYDLLFIPNGTYELNKNKNIKQIVSSNSIESIATQSTVKSNGDDNNIEINDSVSDDLIIKKLNNTKYLKKLLKEPHLLAIFERYLVSEFCPELLRFYMEATRFEDKYYDLTDTTRIALAKRIVNAFISYGSVLMINISATLRNKIEENFNKAEKSKEVDINLFSKAKDEVYKLILLGPFYRFILKQIKSKNYVVLETIQRQ